MLVDIFNHIYPKEYLDALPKPLPQQVSWISASWRGVNDLEYRLNQLDKFGIDLQVLSLPLPTIDDLAGASMQQLEKLTKAGDDGIARIVEKSHGRFKGIATISLLDVGKAVDELQRAVKELGLLGAQILSNVRGQPLDLAEFDPFYAKVTQLGCGLWVHPANIRKIYDWMNDDFNMNLMMGWGIDNALAMFRIFRGGVLERHPTIKIVPHHMGTLIPLMAGRISSFVMGQGKDGFPPPPLKKSAMEYMKMFYVDTAEAMWKPALQLSHSFFGSSHMLFGTDYPWGDTPQIIENIRTLEISEEEKHMIFAGNALRLFKID